MDQDLPERSGHWCLVAVTPKRNQDKKEKVAAPLSNTKENENENESERPAVESTGNKEDMRL